MPDEQGNYTPPPSGNLPERGKRILAEVYQKEREGGLGKERSAKISWGAVKKAGYHERGGKWYYCRHCGYEHTPQDQSRYEQHKKHAR